MTYNPIPLEIQERVIQGADFLDNKVPGWAKRINLETLEMSSICRCSLGQLYGDFTVGRNHLNLNYERSVNMGFDARGLTHIDRIREFSLLDRAWRAAIELRL